jgi:hypothetical protein
MMRVVMAIMGIVMEQSKKEIISIEKISRT